MGDLLFNIISFQNVSNIFKNYYKILKFVFKSKNFKNTEKYTLKKMCLFFLIYYFIKYILCSFTNNTTNARPKEDKGLSLPQTLLV